MIMPRGQLLLMPVRPAYIVASLVVGLALAMLPLGRVPWTPDILLVVLGFWGLQQPLRVGMGIAFALGLCMDVQQTSLFGQHALSYAVLMYGCVRVRALGGGRGWRGGRRHPARLVGATRAVS